MRCYLPPPSVFQSSHARACTQAGLLLASNAALVTTAPPEQGILDYTIRAPYLCLWASFGILLGGIIVGAADVYVLATSYPGWVHQVRPVLPPPERARTTQRLTASAARTGARRC